MPELILHQVPIGSSHCEKMKLIFGFKGLRWRAVALSPVMPRPDLAPVLTAGYRKTPVLQVGADVYCDTRAIVGYVERNHPEPTLYPKGARGLCEAISRWIEPRWFVTATMFARFRGPEDVQGLFGGSVDLGRFVQDRTQLLAGSQWDVARDIRRLFPYALDQLSVYLRFVEGLLANGPYLAGGELSIADFSAYHPLWMLRRPPAIELLEHFPRVLAWMERVSQIGYGDSAPMSSQEALAIAREARPGAEGLGFDDATGRKPGDLVIVAPDDYGLAEANGELVAATRDEIAILHRDARVGEVCVHFPRVGFQILPAEAAR